ncbi:UNVERIFIED_CONTAM: hypothetical protein FKN15_005412 [Acipenser sinensis]
MTEEVLYSDIIFSKTPGEGGTVTSTIPAHRAVQLSSRSSVIFALGAAVCVLLVVVIGMGIANDPCEICPKGWMWRYKGSCYNISKEKDSWDSSNNACPNKGDHLVVIENNTELEFLRSKITGQSRPRTLHLPTLPTRSVQTKNLTPACTDYQFSPDQEPYTCLLCLAGQSRPRTLHLPALPTRSVQTKNLTPACSAYQVSPDLEPYTYPLCLPAHFSTTLAMEMDNIYTGLQKPSEDVYSTINKPQGRTAGAEQGACVLNQGSLPLPVSPVQPSSCSSVTIALGVTVCVLLVAVIGMGIATDLCEICPRTWRWKYNGSCYDFSLIPQTWVSSSNACSKDGGHLVVINDQQELHFLRGKMVGGTFYWIGLKGKLSLEEWRWVDNTTFNETLFAFNNTDHRGRDCVIISNTKKYSEPFLQCQSHLTEFSNAALLYMNDLSKAEQQYKMNLTTTEEECNNELLKAEQQYEMNLTATENELKNERRIAGQYRNDLRKMFCVDPNTGKQEHMASNATSPPVVPVIVPGQERRLQGPTGGNVVSRNAPPAWAIPPPIAPLAAEMLPVAMLSDEKADTSHADSFSWGNSGCGNATMGNAVSRCADSAKADSSSKGRCGREYDASAGSRKTATNTIIWTGMGHPATVRQKTDRPSCLHIGLNSQSYLLQFAISTFLSERRKTPNKVTKPEITNQDFWCRGLNEALHFVLFILDISFVFLPLRTKLC